MTDPRVLLDEIQQRAGARHEFSHRDSQQMVAALRAVLDLHQPSAGKRYDCGECEYFTPCPTLRAITKSLAGES